MTRLALCPFCGDASAYAECIDIGLLGCMEERAVICNKCGARGPLIEVECGKKNPDQKSIAAWNRRATLRAGGVWVPVESVKALREELYADSMDSRWGLHGHGCVDDDYFSALEYCVEKLDAMLAADDGGSGR